MPAWYGDYGNAPPDTATLASMTPNAYGNAPPDTATLASMTPKASGLANNEVTIHTVVSASAGFTGTAPGFTGTLIRKPALISAANDTLFNMRGR